MHTSLVNEELAVLLHLAGHGGQACLLGATGYQDVDDEGFDVGMRALISRGLVVPTDEGVKVHEEAVLLAEALVRPEHGGYCIVASEEPHDAMLLVRRGPTTVLASALAPGAFDVAVLADGIGESVVKLARALTDGAPADGWVVGLRFHPLGGEHLDIAVGADRFGIVSDGAVRHVTAEELTALVDVSMGVLDAA
jgi:hypothetical protein